MPTATEFFGITAHNLGPLTTTYTAPSSCATNLNYHVFVNATSPHDLLAVPSCSWPKYGDCVPSAKEWELTDQQTTTFYQGTSVFFSPGIACPAGWNTVGLLAHTESGKFSASGVLATPAPKLEYEEGLPELVYPTDYWKNMLDESETFAYCCPSGYGGNVYGECSSLLGPVSSYTYSEICQRYGRGGQLTIISSVDGLTYTDGVLSLIEPTRAYEVTSTAMLDLGELQQETGNGFSDIAIASWTPAIPLVYKKSDMDKGDSDDSETGSTAVTGEGSGESAASTVQRQSFISVLGLALGILAGGGMLFF
ncbi:hypothetical protein FPOAC2_04121 [Fusarium poae]|uniref:Uncharacterized protein n=1 Tax=Fusarium poae TaxID=36050 RepID=A0A1B8ARE6_FUSPO|nr:hypothetical protein FPOAC1_004052 [Fusarium poae]KAG8670818.1 hypothetical protein FPOAC1_004052 [Fusarium poae]OBS23083.1 hypothetical protein FPOA_03646 [Fusarium poae]